MKRTLFSLLILLPGWLAAQSIQHARTTSYYTYLYQLSTEEARELYSSGFELISEHHLHTLVDSFPTEGGVMPALPLGHYLQAHTEEHELILELHNVGRLSYEVINNERDLILLVHDSIGTIIPDAEVRIGGKRIVYDSTLTAYRLNKTRKEGLVEINWRGHADFYRLEAKRGPVKLKQVMLRLAYTPPIRWVWRPPTRFISSIVRSIRYGYAHGWIYRLVNTFDGYTWENRWENWRDRRFTGYLATNQPIYRPGDTVRVKGFFSTRSGRPLKREIDLYLTGNTSKGYQRKLLTSFRPTHPGSYVHEFVLHDSLNLQLDQRYSLEAENGYYTTFGELSFRLEDYELKRSQVSMRLEKGRHQIGEQQSLILRVQDQNDFDLPATQVRLTVLSKGIHQFFGAHVVIPDTLWTQEQVLDPIGETRLALPDTIFPKLSFSYQVKAHFVTADQEIFDRSLEARFDYEGKRLSLEYEGDSLVAKVFQEGNSIADTATLRGWNAQNQLVLEKPISLPHKEVNQAFIARYQLSQGQQSVTANGEAGVQAYAQRTKDSLFIELSNPHRVPVWYHLYRNNRLIQKGNTRDWRLRMPTQGTAPYFLSLQYLWQGEMSKEEYRLDLNQKNLRLSVNQPTEVYPGQEIEISVEALDYRNRPVANVDVLAYGLNAAFKDIRAPDLPTYPTKIKDRKSYNTFEDQYPGDVLQQAELPWDLWKDRLDSQLVYQFLFPDTGLFRYEIDALDSLTQIAPYVVREDGHIDPVMVAYVDGIPIFIRATEGWNRYSFPLRPGYRKLALRTLTRKVVIDSLWVPVGKKLILSASTHVSHPDKQVIGMPPELMEREWNLLRRYVMPVDRNNFSRFAYITQQGRVFWPQRQYRSYGSSPLIGPIKPRDFRFQIPEEVDLRLEFEPGFQYEFRPEWVKLKELPYQLHLPFEEGTEERFAAQEWEAFAVTEKEILKAWEKRDVVIREAPIRYDHPTYTEAGYGQLLLNWRSDSLWRAQQIILLSRQDPSFLRVFLPYPKRIHQVPPGTYELLVVRNGAEYFHLDNLNVQANARSYYAWEALPPLGTDSLQLDLIRKTLAPVHSRTSWDSTRYEIQQMQMVPDMEELGDGFPLLIHGKIIDEEGEALVGATVLIKGTARGAIADERGEFELGVPEKGSLLVSYIGFESQEISFRGSEWLEIRMIPSMTSLDEVVVVGYGIQKAVSVTGAISTISSVPGYSIGKVSAVQAKGDALWWQNPLADLYANDTTVNIRGASSLGGNPLIVIDGVPFSGDPSTLTPDQIKGMHVLKGEAATSIYGSRGANGVILIQTKEGPIEIPSIPQLPEGGLDFPPQSALPLAAAGLRRNFRDYAYWLPQLRTDRDGKATATVRLPDDITRWQSYALAVGPKRLTGQAQGSLRSFKPLQAQLAMPRFLLWGDSTQLIGKVQNFQGGMRSLKRQFALQADTVVDGTIEMELSHLDTLWIEAPEADSLELTYLVRESGGYWDGEVREVPLVLPGSQETEGHFLNLETDSRRSFSFDSEKGPVRLIAEANWLGVLRQEIHRLGRYRYLCNEQAASKLTAFLWEGRICEQLNEPFDKEKQIEVLIRRLAKTQLKEGGWGWWSGNQQSDWITQHVARALLMAKADGYDLPVNWQSLTESLQYEVLRSPRASQLGALLLLHDLKETTDARPIVDSLQQDTTLSIQQQLQLLQVQQRYELPHSLDSLWKHRQSTLRGNQYWPEYKESGRFSVENSLLAYDLLEKAGNQDSSFLGIRNAFLERYQEGQSLNTYQAARILATFLPRALAESDSLSPPQLTVKGDAQLSRNQFPLDTLLEGVRSLAVERTGSGPLYLSLTQSWHNPQPLPKNAHFQLRSWFGEESGPVKELEAGKAIQLQVEVEVLAESEYLLIEVPIPAGCSYSNKSAGKHPLEVHREYFREQVGIFCQKLSPGTYRFSVELMPRFSGTYTLNPPRVEPMYQPSLFGRGEMKRVVVD